MHSIISLFCHIKYCNLIVRIEGTLGCIQSFRGWVVGEVRNTHGVFLPYNQTQGERALFESQINFLRSQFQRMLIVLYMICWNQVSVWMGRWMAISCLEWHDVSSDMKIIHKSNSITITVIYIFFHTVPLIWKVMIFRNPCWKKYW